MNDSDQQQGGLGGVDDDAPRMNQQNDGGLDQGFAQAQGGSQATGGQSGGGGQGDMRQPVGGSQGDGDMAGGMGTTGATMADDDLDDEMDEEDFEDEDDLDDEDLDDDELDEDDVAGGEDELENPGHNSSGDTSY